MVGPTACYCHGGKQITALGALVLEEESSWELTARGAALAASRVAVATAGGRERAAGNGGSRGRKDDCACTRSYQRLAPSLDEAGCELTTLAAVQRGERQGEH